MRKLVLILMIISMICITGCGSPFTENEKDETVENIEVNQKIVLIYLHQNYSEDPTYIGFYVNSEGDKIHFDFSEIARSYWERKYSHFYIGYDEMYQFLLELQDADSEEFLTPADVSKCYKLLSQISDDYDIDEKMCTTIDGGTYSWYGVLDDGVNPPELILLSVTGDAEEVNTDKNAEQIMKILKKKQWNIKFPIS
ncbi:MAG: hypothetical protein K2M78_06150 [Lachnospiraceae bacterium]|nr:hypothetical protein [Lachnospiraceae bacterium]